VQHQVVQYLSKRRNKGRAAAHHSRTGKAPRILLTPPPVR
jgi:hypothetical protein